MVTSERKWPSAICSSGMAVSGKEIETFWSSIPKKGALDFFQEFFKKITEGRADYELIAQEVLG